MARDVFTDIPIIVTRIREMHRTLRSLQIDMIFIPNSSIANPTLESI